MSWPQGEQRKQKIPGFLFPVFLWFNIHPSIFVNVQFDTFIRFLWTQIYTANFLGSFNNSHTTYILILSYDEITLQRIDYKLRRYLDTKCFSTLLYHFKNDFAQYLFDTYVLMDIYSVSICHILDQKMVHIFSLHLCWPLIMTKCNLCGRYSIRWKMDEFIIVLKVRPFFQLFLKFRCFWWM